MSPLILQSGIVLTTLPILRDKHEVVAWKRNGATASTTVLLLKIVADVSVPDEVSRLPDPDQVFTMATTESSELVSPPSFYSIVHRISLARCPFIVLVSAQFLAICDCYCLPIYRHAHSSRPLNPRLSLAPWYFCLASWPE